MTLLKQATALDNLHRAWEEIAENKGIAGVDDITIKRWQRNYQERLHALSINARNGTYKPRKLRLRRIPKKTPGEYRILRIPTVTDRVLQRAVLQVLYPIYEPRFLDCSYGYRPGRSLKDAVQRIILWRVNEYEHVLDADIDDFFNQVDHAILLNFLRQDLPDQSLFTLFHAWLKVGRTSPEEARGIPMGSPISPLFANVYLHRLDMALKELGFPIVRYADDFVVFSETSAGIEQAYQRVEQILNRLELHYEPAKTRLTTFEDGFTFVGVHFQNDSYEYVWKGKRVEVHGDEVDWLFSQYGPDYD
ncbi:MAG: group II intron reverse transcriptase/maturase [Gammaproteobacteria bacterium]|nr:MAG: group II intron reverse transcriptase/maturase [Gammaproteobacteria bacterium]